MSQSKTDFQFALYHGVILGVITILFTTVDAFIPVETKTQNSVVFGTLVSLAYIFSTSYVLVTAMKARKATHEGYISFGQAMNITAVVGLVSSAIAQGWNVLRLYVLMPSSLQEMKNMQQQVYEQMGFDDAVIEKQMEMVNVFMQPHIMFTINIITGFIFTILVGLIISAIVKKDKEHPF